MNIHDFVKLHAQYACSVCWVHVSVSVHSRACMNVFSPILDMFSWSLSPQCTNVASCAIYWEIPTDPLLLNLVLEKAAYGQPLGFPELF